MPSCPRQNIITPETPSFYHCMNRVVQGSYLVGVHQGRDYSYRKAWFTQRLEALARIFCVEIGSFAIMDNHFHVLIKTRPDKAESMTDAQVIHSWWQLFPRKIRSKKPSKTTDQSTAQQKDAYEDRPPKALMDIWAANPAWILERRRRLACISWFMQCLTEYIAKKANKEDDKKGHFFQSRFKCTRLQDENAVLQASIYVDLNPVRAHTVRPEDALHSPYTSIRARIEQTPELIFLAKFADTYNHLKEEAPFLAIDPDDYMALCQWYASRHVPSPHRPPAPWPPSKNPPPSSSLVGISEWMRRHPLVAGGREAVLAFAHSMGRRWFHGVGLG